MPEKRSAADYLPGRARSLTALHNAAERCRGCDLYQQATQVVFGDGPKQARLMFVGEAPGSTEDREGRPFVGQAGKLLRESLAEIGLDPANVYITNVVKHFPVRESASGRRVPRKPRVGEERACLPWLEAEVAQVQPAALVCLGATAAQALIDRKFKITRQHGEIHATRWSDATLATYHPAALLRMRGSDRGDEATRHFLEDLQAAATCL
ncbi:MAG: UdgX family uracil-DNA binding protein [Phycisphaeraceae bacterium]